MDPQNERTTSRNSHEEQQSTRSASALFEDAGPNHVDQHETLEHDDPGEFPLSITPAPDPAQLSLIKCCEWLETKLDFRTKVNVEEMPEIRSAFMEFITDPTKESLFVYEDRAVGRVTAKFVAIEVSANVQVMYFWKDSEHSKDGNIDEFNISSIIFFGTFCGSPEASLISLIKNLFLVDVRNNKSWPITLKKDLVASLERFMANMNDVSCNISGKTILYIPQDELESIKDCAAEKDLVQRLESSVIHWTRQIKATLNLQELTGRGQESVEDASPLAELAFWSSRSADLSGIEHQLKDPKLLRIVEVLQQAKSSYLQNFLTLAEHIQAKTLEARDNHKVLKPLEDPCTRLLKATLLQIPPLLEEIIGIVRAIWTWSEHFTSSENVPGLLRKVSNTVIARCRASISIQEVMEGDIAKSVEVLSRSLHVMESWRKLYLSHARLIAANVAKRMASKSDDKQEEGEREPNLKVWDGAFESRIFAQMDAFMQRCRNLLELCEWRAQFTYKLTCDVAQEGGASAQAVEREDSDDGEEEDEDEGGKKKHAVVELLPAFGGTQATEIYSSLKTVRDNFHKYMNHLEKVKYDPLDVRAPEWHEDFSLFKTQVKDLETVLHNIIKRSLDAEISTFSAFDTLEAFKNIATRDTVRRVVEKKTLDLIKKFEEDLNLVRMTFDQNRKNPTLERRSPKYAGAAQWASGLLLRIKKQFELLSSSYHVVSCREWQEVKAQESLVSTAIGDYIEKAYTDWQKNYNLIFQGGGPQPMDNTLLAREPETQLLMVNFSPDLLRLFREVEVWEVLGRSIPFVAMENARDRDKINVIRHTVRCLAVDYNRILTSLRQKWERRLFVDKIKSLDRKISPAVTKMNWGTKGITSHFYPDASRSCQSVKAIVDDFNSKRKGIYKNIKELSDLPLIRIESKKLYDDVEFEAAQSQHRKKIGEKLGRLHSDIRQTLSDLCKLFAGDSAESAKELDNFVLDTDSKVQESLSMALRKSLQELSKAINGDKRTEPQQIFRVLVILEKSGKLVFSPSLNQLTALINTTTKEMIEMLSNIQRLKNDDPTNSIAAALANEDDVMRAMLTIMGGMTTVSGKMQKHMSYWENFKYIWDNDKSAFMRRYMKSNRTLANFEEEILKYKNLEREVLAEESMTAMSFIVVDCNALKQDTVNHCIEWQNMFTALLNDLARKDLNHIIDAINSTTEKLKVLPTNLQELAVSVNLLKQQKADLVEIKELFTPIHEKYALLQKYEVSIDQSELDLLASLQGRYEQFQQFLDETDKHLISCKRNMKSDLEKAVGSFESDIKSMAEKFEGSAPVSLKNFTTEQALNELKKVREKLEQNKIRQAQLKEGMAVFDFGFSASEFMTKTEEELEVLKSLWEMMAEWEQAWDDYKNSKFKDLVANEMEETAGRFNKKIMQKKKEARGRPLWVEIKAKVDAFRATMPLLQDLRNTALRERHWLSLMEEIGQTFDYMSDHFTLERVIDLGLNAHGEFISALSASASKELMVEQAITTIKNVWESLPLETVAYRDRGHFRIKTVEDIYSNLDDNVVTLSTLKGTRFAAPFMEEIVYWEKSLSAISETVEVMQQVQKAWMYLENIFVGSEDIRRQLPSESGMFDNCDRGWMFTMKRVRENSTAKAACTEEGTLQRLNEMLSTLERIQKSLDAYLETKRVAFPRFYFVSSDDLLEILGQARDPQAVQPHLKKCFDAIKTLKMDSSKKRVEATGMNSPEAEFVPFQNPVQTEGPVEYWMLAVETAMRLTLKKILYQTMTSMKGSKKEKWVSDWPGQLLITAGQLAWTVECEKGLTEVEKGDKGGLKLVKKKWIQMLNKYSDMVRGGLSKGDRGKLVAIITIEVHARDVIDRLIKGHCSAKSDFEWLSQLRFVWEVDTCRVEQISAKFEYGYEYLGNCGRLVITPLTDRAYMTLTTALHLKRGGNPQGPAGTGKTETVKDLGKAIAKYVIVFNCSDGLDYKSMGRMFSGLAQTGAWSCFDEFNRIDIEVLSVVAQQILSILRAITLGLQEFDFEGKMIKLDTSCGIFVTMNPGYAGRTELPDNLKAILRPISMMTPDMALIAEIMLYSEGFLTAKILSKKLTGLFELMIQQLSKQDHYDYGLRNTKSILVAAGALKRSDPGMQEDVLLYRTIRDMQLPKLIAEDVPLFNALNSDFFPGLEIAPTDYGVFQQALEKALEEKKLQKDEIIIRKSIQIYEVKLTRHGNMLVGQSCSGKSTAWTVLQEAMKALNKAGVAGYESVKQFVINPKSLSDGELYGQYDLSTGEWLDGVLSRCMREACSDESSKQKWLVLDGPVDTLWIESMNTVLDDNKLLTLVSGERISMPPQVSLLFEVQDLAVASPATVSRAGMVYFDGADFNWRNIVRTWISTCAISSYGDTLHALFEKLVDGLLQVRKKECKEPVPCIDINVIRSLCNLMDTFCTTANGISVEPTPESTKLVSMWYTFSAVWSIGGAVDEEGRRKIDNFLRENEAATLQGSGTLYDYVVDKKGEWANFADQIPATWKPANNMPFYKVLVPTVDTVRFSYIAQEVMIANKQLLIVGDSGVGKSFIMQETVGRLGAANMSISSINFSAQTSSQRVQFIIEGRVEKRTKDVFGPPGGKKMVYMIDDMNMPAKDTFGSQPPLELMRHWLDYGFWYDRQKQVQKFIKDIQLLGIMGYPGGGRSVITMRLQSRFNVLNITFPQEAQLKRIFSLQLSNKLLDFDDEVKGMCDGLTSSTIQVYNTVCSELLPTPTKSHYLFNLRDLCKVLQGLLRATPKVIDSKASWTKLWVHECFRVFSDRLIDDKDREWFFQTVDSKCNEAFSVSIANLFDNKGVSAFGNFMQIGASYEEYSDFTALKSFFEGKLEEYNYEPGYVAMNLVLFRDAIEHVCRIVRVLSTQRGNVLLVGVGGSGRQSLCRLATFVAGHKLFMIEITKQYRKVEWHEDLKKLYVQAGVSRKETVFLFTDTQIVMEGFLEDINGILGAGEVPNLYGPDEMGEIREGIKQAARQAGIEENNDSLYAFFIEQARNHMHLALCFSPVGDSFRVRCRMFPALVSCTSMDWFAEWPVEALKEVALKFTEEVNLGTEEVKKACTEVMATAHASVSAVSKRMQAELKRINYVTPTNYLELVTGYLSLLAEKRRTLEDRVKKYLGGVEKIQEARVEVEAMSKVLAAKRVEVAQASKETEELLVVIVKEKAIADEQERTVSIDAEKIGKDEAATKVIADQAQADLDKAIPALEAAAAALNSLKKKDIDEIKAYAKPPPAVEKVLSAVLILRKAATTDWAEAKKHMGDTNFLKQLIDYDKDNMSDALLKKLDKFVQDPDFVAEKVELVSNAAGGLCRWVCAMSIYGSVYKTVAPKREKLKQAMMSLEKKQSALRKAQAALQEVKEKVQGLQNKYDTSISTKERLALESSQLELKLERADQLVNGLSGERDRWEGSVANLHRDIANSVGDCVVAAAFLSYAGPFNSDFRKLLVTDTWMPMIVKLQIPISPTFDFSLFLAEPTDVREWNLKGLPSDAFSIENGVLVTRGRRWPLMIDPQAQANKWIKNLDGERGLKIVDLKMSDWMRTMENAIQFGTPMLIQDLGQEVDPALEPVLSKSTTKQGNRRIMKLGDKEIDYNPDFKLYLTTKLNNPHYPPEVSTKTTIVNFAIKQEGLEAQILGILVKKERPDLEEKNQQLVVQVAKGKNQLAALEDRILHLLSTATGSLLDDDALVTTLQSSKTISNDVTEQIRVAEATKVSIDQARESYRPSAFRASILYFVLNDMSIVDPMYQFSLDSYVTLFLGSIARSPKSDKIEDRLKNLNEYHTFSVYQNTCRGLFERHKLLFSLHMCTKIMVGAGKLNKEEYVFFLRGGQSLNRESQAPNPAPEWITEPTWNSIVDLSGLTAFKDIDRSFTSASHDWRDWFTQGLPEACPLPGEWQSALNELQRLVVLRCIRPDRVVYASTSFIINNLSAKYVEPPAFDLGGIFAESTPELPLIFILSPGVDPFNALQALATSQGRQDRLKSLALGQGQAPMANSLLAVGMRDGHWVLLANCHLMISWMNALEKLVEGLAESKPHRDFRLWLSSYPHPKFPISILQAGIKMVTEPPKGLKANMIRLYNNISEAQFTRCQAGFKYRRLLFCLVFFHGVLVERRKFGTLGYNVPYDFNESDFDISEDCLAYYLDAYPATPWDALRYLIADANYGGRVTDDFDFRLVRTYIRGYFVEEALAAESFQLAPPLENYRVPDDGPMRSYTDYIRGLPVLDDPEAFGQHGNADIAAQIAETGAMLDTLGGLQPQEGGGGGGGGREERVLKLTRDLAESVPLVLDHEGCRARKADDPSALHVFLLQELERYNKLLRVMAASLRDVQRGIRGLVVMSAELDDVVSCLTVGKVPPTWGRCFPSLKPLGSWMKDVALRVAMLGAWSEGDYPKVYWMSGFSYPTGFLTALLQTAARAGGVSVDVLSWDFAVLGCYEEAEVPAAPAEGAYIRGMFLEGARWDGDAGALADPRPMELVVPFPVVHFRPVESRKKGGKGGYSCPCYMYPVRTGSRERPSYTVSVDLRSGAFDPDHWVKRGTALLLALAS